MTTSVDTAAGSGPATTPVSDVAFSNLSIALDSDMTTADMTAPPPASDMPAPAPASDMPAPNSKKTAETDKIELLPALDFKSESLAAGTDIPPPSPSLSPVKEAPAADRAVLTPPTTPLPPPSSQQLQPDSGRPIDMTKSAPQPPTGADPIKTAGLKRPAEDGPLSPVKSARQGSIRRLFSRGFLGGTGGTGSSAAGNGLNGGAGSSHGSDLSRPSSQGGAASQTGSSKSKRASSWFRRRLRRGQPNQAATVVDVSEKASDPSLVGGGNASDADSHSLVAAAIAAAIVADPGPPAPVIPEIASLRRKEIGTGRESSWGADMFKDIQA